MGSKKLKKKVKNKKLNKRPKIRKSCIIRDDSFLAINDYQCSDRFSQIRENYFNHLQNVIKENVECSENDTLTNEILEGISLEVEQQALLACMRSDIYQRIMVKIIHDIRKSTNKMKLDMQIKSIMLSKGLKERETSSIIKIEQRENDTQERIQDGVYSHIPTISTTRTSCNDFENHWSNHNMLPDGYEANQVSLSGFQNENSFLESSAIDGSLPGSYEAQNLISNSYCEMVERQFSSHYHCNPAYLTSVGDPPVDNCQEKSSMNGVVSMRNEIDYFAQNLVPLESTNSSEQYTNVEDQSVLTNDDDDGDDDDDDDDDDFQESSAVSPVPGNVEENMDVILKSRSQLQKSVEKSLSNLKRINVQKKEERERAQIARILEDEDFDDDGLDNQCDSLSDNCDEPTVNSSNNDRSENLLSDRLEEMRQIFGMEDDADDEEKATKEISNTCDRAQLGRSGRKRKFHKHFHLWHHERIIQMHRLSLLASEMTAEMRRRNRKLFLKLFGEDSDEENELDFYCEDKYLTSCKERISSWVVKYLMPFYNRKRIVGRSVFKSLGHHVSSSIIEQIQYPDEWTVKYFVTKFFPADKQFIHENDIFSFQIS